MGGCCSHSDSGPHPKPPTSDLKMSARCSDIMVPEERMYCESEDWTEVWSEDWSDPELSNWIKFNPTWLGRQHFWFNPANVATGVDILEDGSEERYAVLRTYVQDPVEDDHFFDKNRETLKYGTAFMRSQFQFCYGRLEAEVKPSSTALSSAFWLVRDEFQNTPGYERLKEKDEDLKKVRWEFDVFELSTAIRDYDDGRHVDHAKRFHTNVHYFCRDPHPQNIEFGKHYDMIKDPLGIGLNRTDDRFKVAFEWTKDYIKWEVNGKVLRTATFKEYVKGDKCDKNCLPFCQEAMWIQFDMEIIFGWFGLPSDEEVTEDKPAEFKIYNLKLLQKGGEDMYVVYHPFDVEKHKPRCTICAPTAKAQKTCPA